MTDFKLTTMSQFSQHLLQTNALLLKCVQRK